MRAVAADESPGEALDDADAPEQLPLL